MKRLAVLFVVLFSALTWAQQKEDPCALKPPKGSDVALVEYEDLQCPDCARAAPLLKKSQMLRRIMQDVGKASGAAEDAVWFYLCDIPAANVAECGRVLPPPGEEDAWFSSLADAMRERLRPLA